ncbi:hypothetical protein E1I18_00680 [Mycoplasmopsis mucosicanis]|uniref:Lipoprotein n=1 Tax=Mycoplasmopsis mucosicanis TaxID=458208 RepID=A0A507SV45_9BACT|nr:hypothetical protein [Mycoplasmopsis mucosicanis]TQC54105.1 hypothetical protein E1I18_00680 [Mycoplasmopsis mucosicanis]
MRRKFWRLSLAATSISSIIPLVVATACNNNPTDNKRKDDPSTDIRQDITQINKAKDSNLMSRLALEAQNLVNNNYFVYSDKVDQDNTDKAQKYAKTKVDFTKIEDFDKFTSNDYVYDYINFDNEAFKKDLIESIKDPYFKEKIKSQAYTTQIVYHSIRRSDVDFSKVIIPIRFTRIVDAEKKLKEARDVEFLVSGIKNSSKENKYVDVVNLSNEIKPKITNSDFKIDINKEKLSYLEQYEPNDLSIKMLNELFSVKLSEEKENEIKALIEKYNHPATATAAKAGTQKTTPKTTQKAKPKPNEYEYKYFVEGIKFIPGSHLKYELNIRVGVAENAKDPKKIADTAFDTKIAFTIEDERDQQIKDQLVKSALREDLVIQPIKNSIYNLIWEKLNDYEIFNYSRGGFEVSNFSLTQKTNSRRNADAKWKVKYNDKDYELNKNFGVGEFVDLYDTEFMLKNQNLVQFVVNKLTETDLPKINASMYSFYGNNLFTGGYDELRGFYEKSNDSPRWLHVGEDYLAPENTAIVAPFDGELVGAYFVKGGETLHEGIGTNVVTRYKLENLKISPRLKEKWFSNTDHFYIGYMHQNANLVFNNPELVIESKEVVADKEKRKKTIDVAKGITPKTPIAFKKGQKISFVGTTNNNGGWMPHTHVTIYNPINKYRFATGFDHENGQNYDKRIEKYSPDVDGSTYKALRVDGVFSVLGSDKKYKLNPLTASELKNGKNKIINGSRQSLILPIQRYETGDRARGVVNPNLIFKLRGEESYFFNVEDYYEVGGIK